MKELNLEKLATLQGGDFWSSDNQCSQLSDGSYYRQRVTYRFWVKGVSRRSISDNPC